MSKQIKDYLGLSAIAGLILVVIAVFWFAVSYSDSVDPETSFSVSAEGEVVAVPDVAEVTATVITEGDLDLGNLQDENTTKMNGLIEYIKEQDVDEKDIKTTSYNINPRYQNRYCSEREGDCPPPEIVGYTVRQNVNIKIRDFSNIGSILSGVVREGANSVSGLSFTIDDPTEVRAEARKQAIEKAKEKARNMAEDVGFSLGELLSIHENTHSPYQSVYLEERAVSDAAGGGASPNVEPGSQEVKVNVSLSYEIK